MTRLFILCHLQAQTDTLRLLDDGLAALAAGISSTSVLAEVAHLIAILPDRRYLTLQAHSETLLLLDNGLGDLEALRRKYLARLAEVAAPGSLIALRRDAGESDYEQYSYYLARVVQVTRNPEIVLQK